MSRSLAIALGYRPEVDLAPQVLAAGSGVIAERIREIAARHSIPLEEDTGLAERLFELEVGEDLPEELYLIVARIFAYLDHVARKVEAEQLEAEPSHDRARVRSAQRNRFPAT